MSKVVIKKQGKDVKVGDVLLGLYPAEALMGNALIPVKVLASKLIVTSVTKFEKVSKVAFVYDVMNALGEAKEPSAELMSYDNEVSAEIEAPVVADTDDGEMKELPKKVASPKKKVLNG